MSTQPTAGAGKKVQVTQNGEVALVKPAEFLGPAFGLYRDVCNFAGARYSGKDGGSLCSIEALVRLVTQLRTSGFQVALDGALADRLQQQSQKVAAVAVAAGAQAERAVERAARVGIQLYPFQVEGVAAMAARDRFLNGDEMGLGKTIQALFALPEDVAAIVVVPAAVKGNWRNECRKCRPDLEPVILSGRGSFRWPLPGELLIVNYDILPVGVPAAPKGVVVLADEAHALKSSKAQRTVRFRALAKAARANGGRTWLLTGTAMLNRPPELWQVLQSADLAVDAFTGWTEFCRLFNGHQDKWGGWTWGTPSYEVVERLRRVSLKRRRTEVLPQLPTKTWRTVDVEIDNKTRRAADAVLQGLRAKGIDLEAASDRAVLTAIGKVAFEEMAGVRRMLAVAKIPALLEQVAEFEANDEPVVVFSAHVAPVEALAARPGWATIRGGDDAEGRTRVVQDFQEGRLKGLALTIQAGGVGLTLTRASQALFVDLMWTPALNDQAEDRICRIGQTRGCVITRLVAEHAIDQRVTALLTTKRNIIDASVEAAAVVTVERSNLAEQLAALAVDAATPPPPPDPDAPRPEHDFRMRRLARNYVERWAANELLIVAANDPDHAAIENGIGFSGSDGTFGHSLARAISAGDGLTDRQWQAVAELATKYRRQIGPLPLVVDAMEQGL